MPVREAGPATPPPVRAIVSDIDGTLWSGNSWARISEVLEVDCERHEALFQASISGALSVELAHDGIRDLWRNSGKATRAYLEQCFHQWPLKPGARELFDFSRDRGYRTCLITGAVDLFAAVIAERVGADEWYANATLFWDEQGVLTDFVEAYDDAQKKVEQFLTFCVTNQLRPDECLVLGDDRNDLELFRCCGRGIVVDSPTSAVIEDAAWRKVSALSEILSLL